MTAPESAETGDVVRFGNDPLDELRRLVEWMDADLDDAVADAYKAQPLAQDWARVTKCVEEAGEAVDALIGATGQNPRKGFYGTPDDVLKELADVALTGLYAIQHFTKDADDTIDVLMRRARRHHERRRNDPRYSDGISDGPA